MEHFSVQKWLGVAQGPVACAVATTHVAVCGKAVSTLPPCGGEPQNRTALCIPANSTAAASTHASNLASSSSTGLITAPARRDSVLQPAQPRRHRCRHRRPRS